MTDGQIITEVRALTDYDTSIIDRRAMSTLIDSAKDEVQDDVGRDLVFDTRTERRALVWLLALFCKVHTGEIGSAASSVGELESEPLSPEDNMWLQNYYRKRDSVRGATAFGSTAAGRADRTYGEGS